MKTKNNVIPKHCEENWLELSSDEKVRFCTLCQKNVFDYNNENKDYSLHFCERYHTNALEKTISKSRIFISKATEFLLKNRAK
jgi:hypothetical protein